MKITKILASLALIAILVLSMTATIFAAPTNNGGWGGGFGQNSGSTGIIGGVLTYRISRWGSASITKCNASASGSIEIPADIDGTPVTEIGDYAFQHCKDITSVTIPEGVTNIGYSAFYGCLALESVNIPSSVENIEYAAFYNCKALKNATIADIGAWCNTSLDGEYANPAHITGFLMHNGEKLTTLTVPSYIAKISGYAFYGCKDITSVIIPESVSEIGECAFYGCKGLTSITVPKSVSEIGEGAFSACDNLSELIIANGNAKYSNEGGNLIELTSKTLIRGVDSGVIPTDGSVTRLGGYAFSGRNMTEVNVPECIVAVGSSAFKDCKKLTTVTFPKTVDVVRSGVFMGCESLTTVNLHEGITFVGVSAFRNCKSLESIKLPSAVKEIKDFAFANCTALKSFTLPKSTKEIGEGVFDGCKSLETIAVEVGNTKYGNNQNCLIDYSNGTLVRGTYQGTVPTDGSVKKIGYYAFSGCTDMETVIIPQGVSEIGINAFDGCDNLKKVYYGSDAAAWEKSRVLDGNDALENVEVLYNNTDMPVKKPSGSGILGNLFGEDENGEGNGILIGEYIHFYNHQRIQLKTKLTPLEKRCQYVA
ncbi:MAG: leucine-rich repeat domain-containing protein [Clostridia bacterium]|nr:leucine-rich repeat domain-containing protein [Clostridia bacterium]